MKNKKTAVLFCVVLAVMIIACIVIIALASGGTGKRYAYIYSQNELLEIIDLGASTDKEFRIESDNGYNIVKVKDSKICVIEADCPDKTCVNTGYTDSPILPVICMPNRLEIIIKDSELIVDGVTG